MLPTFHDLLRFFSTSLICTRSLSPSDVYHGSLVTYSPRGRQPCSSHSVSPHFPRLLALFRNPVGYNLWLLAASEFVADGLGRWGVFAGMLPASCPGGHARGVGHIQCILYMNLYVCMCVCMYMTIYILLWIDWRRGEIRCPSTSKTQENVESKRNDSIEQAIDCWLLGKLLRIWI